MSNIHMCRQDEGDAIGNICQLFTYGGEVGRGHVVSCVSNSRRKGADICHQSADIVATMVHALLYCPVRYCPVLSAPCFSL
jgi:hypothetical protein